MILQRLCEAAPRFSREFEFPPIGYQKRPVKWVIVLDGQGKLLGFVRTAGDELRRKDRGKEIDIPFVLRTSGVAPQLLADRADYVLGYAGSDATEPEKQKVSTRHEAFLDLLDDFAKTSGFPPAEAVRLFLSRQMEELPAELEPADLVTFQVGDRLLVGEAEVREYWARRQDEQVSLGAQGHSLVCGRTAGLANPHPLPIKRVPEVKHLAALLCPSTRMPLIPTATRRS